MGMKTWKNWIFSACLCAGIGTAAGLATSCTPQGQKADPQAADSATVENKNMVVETIMNRRSIRKYKDQPVEREKLQLIAECGVNAPNGMNSQPWELRIVDDIEARISSWMGCARGVQECSRQEVMLLYPLYVTLLI